MSVSQQSIVEIASKCYNCKNAQCVAHCPLHNNIPEIMREVADQQWENAVEVLVRTTLFGGICGIVCPRYRQCEGHCIRAIKDKAVEIGKVESFLSECSAKKIIKAEKTGKHIAVVGGGASGIACALQLLQLGCDVTIYEKNSQLGGIMRYGIPAFRLKKQPIDNLTDLLNKLGCKVNYNCNISKGITLDQLVKDFDAVYLAVGLQESVQLNIDGQDAQGVVSGDSYLVNPTQAHNVVVVGGGNASVDCARTALRHSDRVTLVYRRTRDIMPAYFDEVDIAEQEGVKFEFLLQPREILTQDNKVKAITLNKMKLGKIGSDGRPSVEQTEQTVTIDCDLIIYSIGNRLEGDFLPQIVKNRVAVDDKYRTSIDKVYAGGDMVNNVNTVVYAVKQGKEAGISIAEDLGICVNRQ